MPELDLEAYERTARSLGKQVPDLPNARDEAVTTAARLVEPGKGILAADESGGTMGNRLASVGAPTDAATRLAYRAMLFTAPGLSDHVSGVILYDETIRQDVDGTTVPQLLSQAGIDTGIKVDVGTKPLAATDGEEITEGLDGLRGRLAEYKEMGATFAKWRAVIEIGPDKPSQRAIDANAHAMARYAVLCQESGIVPIVEPEVLLDGDHTIERCEEVTRTTLQAFFAELERQGAVMEGLLLKSSMVVPGKDGPDATPDEVADATLRVLNETVPAEVPGIVFLSGGQSPENSTLHLQAMNARGEQPWAVTFSYARALQEPALDAWKGDAANDEAAQAALVHRARCNGAAATGTYTPDMEQAS